MIPCYFGFFLRVEGNFSYGEGRVITGNILVKDSLLVMKCVMQVTRTFHKNYIKIKTVVSPSSIKGLELFPSHRKRYFFYIYKTLSRQIAEPVNSHSLYILYIQAHIKQASIKLARESSHEFIVSRGSKDIYLRRISFTVHA